MSSQSSVRLRGAWLIVALGVTQIVSWGSIYYLAALLMEPLRLALATSQPVIVGAVSLSILVSGLAAPWVGRRIDRHGGRVVMTAGSVAAVLLLTLLSRVGSVWLLYTIYIGLGLAMAATLYPPAFAVVTQAFGTSYRRAITVVTLFGGFASTVFWPLTTWLVQLLGWRDAVLVLAGINLLLCVPLHLLLPPAPHSSTAPSSIRSPALSAREARRSPGFYALSLSFVGHAVVIAAISVHLLEMLTARGLSPGEAASLAALVGPMQVAGRIVELAISSRASAVAVGRFVTWLLPLSMLLLWAAADLGEIGLLLVLFAALYGVGNGTMTIVRGAVPAELYGREHYGEISGALNGPSLVAGAAAPLLASLLLAALGDYQRVLLVLAAIGALGAIGFAVAVHRARHLREAT
jgi:MFS family permease